MLPADADNARILCQERLLELSQIAALLLKQSLPDPVKAACAHIEQLANQFRAEKVS